LNIQHSSVRFARVHLGCSIIFSRAEWRNHCLCETGFHGRTLRQTWEKGSGKKFYFCSMKPWQSGGTRSRRVLLMTWQWIRCTMTPANCKLLYMMVLSDIWSVILMWKLVPCKQSLHRRSADLWQVGPPQNYPQYFPFWLTNKSRPFRESIIPAVFLNRIQCINETLINHLKKKRLPQNFPS
jgi:hypothetical protein